MIQRAYLNILFVAITILLGITACSEGKDSSGGCSVATEEKQKSSIEPSIETVGVAPALLTEAQLTEYSRAGLAGDGKAAFRVLVYYEMALLDRRNGEFWAQTAAENGHVEGIVSYAAYLLDVPGFESCHRAQFWLGRAKEFAAAEDSDTLSAFEEKIADKCAKVFELEEMRKR